MANDIALSVILPVYNGAGTLDQQLEALAAQEFGRPWELIVADNGSIDESQDIATSWKSRIPSLRLIDASRRRGGAAARNLGAASSSGSHLLFCDQDDVVQPGWLAAMSLALADHDLVAGRNDFEALNRPPGAAADRDGQRRRRTPERFDFYGYLPYGLGCNLGVSRRAFDAVDGFDETIMSANDLDLCWRLQLAGYRLHVEPAAVVAKRGRPVCSAIWRQHFAYGLDDPKLYRRFRAHGMPRKLGRAARRYAWLVAHLHHLRSPSTRPSWIRVAAGQAGRLVGTLRERALYL